MDGKSRQDDSTALMIHSVENIVAATSSYMTLLPGDIICTGTPAGVGPVSPGQVMVGRLEQGGKVLCTVSAPVEEERIE